MTTKILSGHYAGGYSLSANFSAVEVTATGSIGGFGLYAYSRASVTNYGSITANSHNAGVFMYNGGTLRNGNVFEAGHIYGGAGVVMGNGGVGSAASTVLNYSYIGGNTTGVRLINGGEVINSGEIRGRYADGVYCTYGAGTVMNTGTILGGRYDGVELARGGAVTNGSAAGLAGFISGPTGVESNGNVYNFSTIAGVTAGVELVESRLVNGAANDHSALITGDDGVIGAFYTATVVNYGTILGSVGAPANSWGAILDGGSLTNGSASDTAALIKALGGVYLAASGPVVNYGDIQATGTTAGADGVRLGAGASLINGLGGATGATISGYDGVSAGAGAVVANYGSIFGAGLLGAYGVALQGGVLVNGLIGGSGAVVQGGGGATLATTGTVDNYGTIEGLRSAGVVFYDGGTLTNGSAADASATLFGETHGVQSVNAATTIANFATIGAAYVRFSSGVYEYSAGASIINGSSRDHLAEIVGAAGVVLERSGTIVNDGTIYGAFDSGVIAGGGEINNAAKAALIKGAYFGVSASVEPETVRNFGVVLGGDRASDYGVELSGGGRLTNGSARKTQAVIEGYGGAEIGGAVIATNAGTIVGTGTASGAGVVLGAGGRLVNGASGKSIGLIEGRLGVSLGGAAASTLTNFGTIIGTGGTAVQFASAADVLVVGAGSSFVGAVAGDGGTIVLADGAGALTLLAGESLGVSGSMAPTTFSDFGTIEVGGKGVFTLASGGTVAAGEALIDDNRLTLAGALTNDGTLEVAGGVLTADGAVSGTGQAIIDGGTLHFAAAFVQNVAFTAAGGLLLLADAQGFTGAVAGFSKTGATTLDLRDVSFVNTGEASFAGTMSGGVLTVTGGSEVAHIDLVGDYLHAVFTAASDSHGGVDVTASASAPSAPAGWPSVRSFIAAMAAPGAASVGETSPGGSLSPIPAVLTRPHPGA